MFSDKDGQAGGRLSLWSSPCQTTSIAVAVVVVTEETVRLSVEAEKMGHHFRIAASRCLYIPCENCTRPTDRVPVCPDRDPCCPALFYPDSRQKVGLSTALHGEVPHPGGGTSPDRSNLTCGDETSSTATVCQAQR